MRVDVEAWFLDETRNPYYSKFSLVEHWNKHRKTNGASGPLTSVKHVRDLVNS